MDGSTRALADALAHQAVRQGENTPSVRGADWHTATVTAVDATPGTVDCGQIRARRTPHYTLPAVGDLCVLLRSGSGNWVAMPPLATTSGTWTTLTLAAGFTHPGHGYQPGYLVEGRRVWWRGRIAATTGTIANGTTIATIPASVRPEDGEFVGWSSPRNAAVNPAVVRMEITDTGALRTYETANPPTWVSLDGLTYHID
ncbi:hypothetical protein JJV70_02055 [Streptomyces sp. JJ66]|uniref:hypothetical protein n=1 Tax=Streptomyces sp. JJ66 TaxID=2803843 RepID=UPI001C56DDFB|nr:hypothetical protein [Streptomyces sp. JJ66]MBW1600904.1 hypothetical protein [Streptomyces sp. JJ66]